MQFRVDRRTVELRWSSIRPHVALLALVLAAFLLIRLVPDGSLALLRVYVGIAVLFLLPGFLLTSLLFSRALDVGEVLALSVGLSVVSLCLLGFLAFLFQWSLDLLLGLTLGAAAGFLVALRLVKRRTSIVVGNPRVLFVLLFAIAFSVILFRIGTYQDGDAIGHLTWARRLFERGVADQSAFALYPGGLVYPHYSYSCWHLGVALIARVGRVDPIAIWVHLSSVLVVPFICAFWLLAKRLFESEYAAFCVALLYIGVEGVYKGMWIWRLAAYPDQVGKFLLVIGLFLVLEYILGSRRRLWIVVGVTAFALPLIHISAYTYLALLAASFTALAWIMRVDKSRLRRALMVLAALALAAAPIGALKLYQLRTGPAASGIVGMMFQSSEFVRLPFGMYVVNPAGVLAQNPRFPYWFLLSVLGLALAPVALYRAWKTRAPWAVFLSAGVLGTVLYIFNPVIVTAVTRTLGGNLASRATFLLPFLSIFLVGFFVSELLRYVTRRRKEWVRTVLTATLFVALSLGVALVLPRLPAFQYARTLPGAVTLSKESGRLLADADALSFFEETTPDGSVILSSGTSVAALIAPFFDRYPLPPWSGGELLRLKPILNPAVPIDADALGILREYGVTHVLARNVLEVSNLAEYPQLFHPVYFKEPYTLYEVRLSTLEEGAVSLYRQGVALLEEGRYVDAAVTFRKALTLSPGNQEAAEHYATAVAGEIERGTAALEQGTLNEAEGAFLGVLAVESGNAEAAERLGDVSQRYFERAMESLAAGDEMSAFLDLRRSLALHPTESAGEALARLTEELAAAREVDVAELLGERSGDVLLAAGPPYVTSRVPDYWNPQGMELVDGGWASTRDSVAWNLDGQPVVIEFQLDSVYPLHEITVKSTHFTAGYGYEEWRLGVLCSEDGVEFSEVGEFAFATGELGAGEHVWSLPAYVSARYVRVSVLGTSGLVTLGEVEITGYVFPD